MATRRTGRRRSSTDGSGFIRFLRSRLRPENRKSASRKSGIYLAKGVRYPFHAYDSCSGGPAPRFDNWFLGSRSLLLRILRRIHNELSHFCGEISKIPSDRILVRFHTGPHRTDGALGDFSGSQVFSWFVQDRHRYRGLRCSRSYSNPESKSGAPAVDLEKLRGNGDVSVRHGIYLFGEFNLPTWLLECQCVFHIASEQLRCVG